MVHKLSPRGVGRWGGLSEWHVAKPRSCFRHRGADQGSLKPYALAGDACRSTSDAARGSASAQSI
eukprot:14566837-Alexandrium_andersonii.AAC.1